MWGKTIGIFTEVGGIMGGGTIFGVVCMSPYEALTSEVDLLFALNNCFSSSGFLKAIERKTDIFIAHKYQICIHVNYKLKKKKKKGKDIRIFNKQQVIQE